MIITVLIENRPCGSVAAAHGLSLHIQAGGKRILFDFGPEGDLLLRNADALGIDLRSVDLAILSHGHNDHSGGLEAFLRLNDHAPVFCHELAFMPHYSRRKSGLKNISPPQWLPEAYPRRLHMTRGTVEIDKNLTLFSDVTAAELVSGSNATLFEQIGEEFLPDRFLHEQSLLIREEKNLALFAGCAHRGIVNILRRAEAVAGHAPDAVFSGFHLTNPGLGLDEPEELVIAVGNALAAFPARYYTGHCTGEGPCRILKTLLGDRLQYMGCGLQFAL